MKDSQINPIDEFFRDELSSYTVPVAAASATIVAIAAAKKGLLYKFSLFKLNVFYSVVVATGTVGGAGVGVVKAYQYFHEKPVIQNHSTPNNQINSAPNSNSTVFADTLNQLQQQELENTIIEKETTVDSKTQQSVISPTQKTINKVSEPANSVQPENKKLQSNQTIPQNQVTTTVAKKDSVVLAPQVKKVVYVKQQQVVVQDTIVKVVKKKKK